MIVILMFFSNAIDLPPGAADFERFGLSMWTKILQIITLRSHCILQNLRCGVKRRDMLRVDVVDINGPPRVMGANLPRFIDMLSSGCAIDVHSQP